MGDSGGPPPWYSVTRSELGDHSTVQLRSPETTVDPEFLQTLSCEFADFLCADSLAKSHRTLWQGGTTVWQLRKELGQSGVMGTGTWRCCPYM